MSPKLSRASEQQHMVSLLRFRSNRADVPIPVQDRYWVEDGQTTSLPSGASSADAPSASLSQRAYLGMFHRVKTHWVSLLLLFVAVFMLDGSSARGARAGVPIVGTVTEVRSRYPSEWGIPYPVGVAYSDKRGHLALLANVYVPSIGAERASIVAITPYEDFVGEAALPSVVENPINLAYDDAMGRLLLLNPALAELVQVAVDEEGIPDANNRLRVDIGHLGLEQANGMDVDTVGRRLFILDTLATAVVSADLDEGFSPASNQASNPVSQIDLAHLPAHDLRGLAFHPRTQTLFVASPEQEQLYEVSLSGHHLRTYDLAPLALADMRGMSFGASADLTDAPDTIHLFMADSNAPDVGAEPQDSQFGRIVEVALDPGNGNEGDLRFAVIGDYGRDNSAESRVAALIDSWNPDFVITTGDNNYPDGEASTIDDNIGKYFSSFIGNYQGTYGPGSPTNRFWPSLGNHDWHTILCDESGCNGAYFDYFTLPNNERYYTVDLGFVRLYALDSEGAEPDGRKDDSIQANWLQAQLAGSTACHNVVFFHHSPYSSGRHGSNSAMQWPFAAWGADVVMSGHDHLYERLEADGIPYFVNGSGGSGMYMFTNIDTLPANATSIARYNGDNGAMLVTASQSSITYQFYNVDGVLIDEHTVAKQCAGPMETATPTSTPTPIPTPIPTPTATATATPTPTVTATATALSGPPIVETPLGPIFPAVLPENGATVDPATIIHVPGDAPTIQAAIDLAVDGQVVLVEPGVYPGPIEIVDKRIILASRYYITGDPDFIHTTVLDGGGETVITVRDSAAVTAAGAAPVGPAEEHKTKIIGFSIQNGDDGISVSATLDILHNLFVGNKDAVDYESGGGRCQGNLFEDNSDDAIDLDGPTAATIEGNIIRNSNDDGIEIRLHDYTGPVLDVAIRGNVITNNRNDGIQLIDHGGLSDRVFHIEKNLIQGNGKAGLGLMDNGESKEDFRAANITERIYLFNNTFLNNEYGVSGGDNLIAVNNLFVGSPNIALKNVDGNSIVTYTLFWNNGTDQQGSNVDAPHTIVADPNLETDARLSSESPAIDAGTASFEWQAENVLELHPTEYTGVVPDLGAYEIEVEMWYFFVPSISR